MADHVRAARYQRSRNRRQPPRGRTPAPSSSRRQKNRTARSQLRVRWLIPNQPFGAQFQCDSRPYSRRRFFACRQCLALRPRSSPGPRPDPNTPHRTANDFQLQSETRRSASPSSNSGRACSTSEHVIAYSLPNTAALLPSFNYPVLAFSALMNFKKSRSFNRALWSCDLLLPIEQPTIWAISLCSNPSTSCNTKTVR